MASAGDPENTTQSSSHEESLGVSVKECADIEHSATLCSNEDSLKTSADIGKTSADIGKTSADIGKTSADIGKTSADIGKTSADIGKTSADIGKTSADIGKTSADIGKTSADIGKTSADIGKTSADIGKTSADIGKTSADIGKTSADIGKTSADIGPSTPVVSDDVLDQLSSGLLSILLPDIKDAQVTIAEVTENQRILIETVQQENANFGECHAFTQIMETMEKAKVYHAKLVAIKRSMHFMEEKATKLKRRALRLQQQKEKEALQREQKQDRDCEKERRLTAKPAKPNRK